MGQIGVQRPEMAQAATALRRLAERAPLPTIESALKYLEQGQTLAAELVLSTIVELRSAAGPVGTSDAVTAAVLLGDLLSLKHPDEAVAVYLATIEMAPEAADVWNHLGEALTRMADLRGAARSHREALSMATAHNSFEIMAYAHECLGNLALETGDAPTAEQHWTQARAHLAAMSRANGTTLRARHMQQYQPIFCWTGQYWGVLADSDLFDFYGVFRGGEETDGTIWRQDGIHAGELVERAYVLRRRGLVPLVPLAPRHAPPAPPMPSRWPNRMERQPLSDFADALLELP